ncbi:hypothetical protein Poli38472_001239 [Pythium oligandrum]|uniref:Uncharacterized protein n=1 Tax=Pythium oligandrum TaxID=41045 RepID=A0A8K1CVM4_PYTOL|nr:hypothetical protein Poli38472_001239 [Pythium oligandrum]|eukprot:TMW69083.1 hypothetical protein Poli38472_001239 [Pythium oligandrum]
MNTLNFFPQPMEIAFSLDAGAFSSDLFDVNPVMGQDQLLRNATVICFENVLIPFKWMTQQLGLRPTVKGVQEAKERAMRIPYLQEPLARIEQFALQLLTTISSRGPVCILSEQSARFVEILCQVFFPRLAYCLSNPQVLPSVQVIGAPKRFVTTSEKAMWRISIMQSLVRDRLFAGNSYLLADATAGRFGLIVVSPHNIDTVACSKALEVAPFLVPKSVRVANARNLPLDQFALHLQTMTQYLSEAAPCLTPFAVSV